MMTGLWALVEDDHVEPGIAAQHALKLGQAAA